MTSSAISLINTAIGYKTTKEEWTKENINLSAFSGELTAIIGANGSGKSTIIKSIVRILKLKKGEIKVFNKNVEDFSAEEFAKTISYVGGAATQVGFLKVRELAAYGLYPHRTFFQKRTFEDEKKIDQALIATDVKHLENKYIDAISDGERQRAMIARAIVQDTPIILLDEPTAFLDVIHRNVLINNMLNWCRKLNKTILFSTHEIADALRTCDRIWLIGNQCSEGIPEELLFQNAFVELFEDKNFKLNLNNYNFESETKTRIPISIEKVEDSIYQLTVNLVKRMGFALVEDSNLSIRFTKINNEYCWQIDDRCFKKVNDLSIFLKPFLV